MNARSSLGLFMILSAAVGGCQPGIEGTWLGKVDCNAFPWTVSLTFERESGLLYTGSGEQARQFENGEGFDAVSTILFDIEAELVEPTGVQVLDTTFTCTSFTTQVSRPDGDEDISEGCDQSRFEDYALEWDGGDRVQLTSDDQDCSGILERR